MGAANWRAPLFDLLNDPGRRAALRLAARSVAEQEFAWPALAAEYKRAVLNAFAPFEATNNERALSSPKL